ncbi:MAG TPA: hypothetical protein VHC96_05315 [Puia sp.]|nr:hypothetical protein [Puia sp.]
MKKLITVLFTVFTLTAANAQDKFEQIVDRSFVVDAFHISATIFLLYLCFNFVLELLQRNLDHRIKSRAIAAGSSESMVGRLLDRKRKDLRRGALAWICVLLAIGLGLSIINFTLPFGLHSVAIMAFSIGAGLLAFYLISGRQRDASQAGDEMSGKI